MKKRSAINPDEAYQKVLFVLDRKDAYRQIRNYLAGRFIGATRDEALLEEVIKCLFCKLHIKKNDFKINVSCSKVSKYYQEAFIEIRKLLPNVFAEDAELLLDEDSLVYVDKLLDDADLDNPKRDLFGDAYEVFVGSHIRGQDGQFFTPQNAVELLVSMVEPKPGEKLIDPACGAGGFLNAAARYLIAAGVSPEEVGNSVFGVDKDSYLVNLAAARLSLVTLTPGRVYCADSLAWRSADNNNNFSLENYLGKFDIVLANPPFGTRIVAASGDVKKSFDLAYKWKKNKNGNGFIKLSEIQSSVPPQVLFIERCISLVKPGGRIGIVVPESLVSSKNYRYAVNYIQEKTNIKAVMGMPEALFKISGKGGTHTKTCLLLLEKKIDKGKDEKSIFMAEAKWCGNDSRGRQIGKDELPEIALKYRQYLEGKLGKYNHLGYSIENQKIADNILAPRYYNPDVDAELLLLKPTHNLIQLGDLVSSGILEITTGDEVGKLSYGTGVIPFVRTSDISNWEIKVDPKHCVSEEIYQSLAKKQDAREGDILMVKDGTYLIGTCAFITKYDTRIVFQSHLYKLRVKDTSELSPYLLLVALSSLPVRRQVKSKCFTQDIIDSLGNRIKELVLPIPKDREVKERVTQIVKQAINQRIEARELTRKACQELVRIDDIIGVGDRELTTS